MSNYLEIKVIGEFDEKMATETIDLCTANSLDEVKRAVAETWNDQYRDFDDPNAVEATEDEITLNVVDWGEVPTGLQDLKEDELYELAEHYEDSHYDIDVFEAAWLCGVQFADVDEAYQGAHKSDEDFAENMCEDLGEISKDLPAYIHIDWEATARDIMMDYCSANGHYFRNL